MNASSLLILFPVLTPFATAILTLVAGNNRRMQRGLGVAGAALLMAAALRLFFVVRTHGPQAVQIGGWPAPYGITLAADLLSAIMVVLAGFIGLLVAVYALSDINARNESLGYHPLYHILLMGICGAFLTGDIFNLYVWFEVMLIASFVLLALEGGRKQLEGTIKYMTLNLMASAAFLAAIGILYGLTGTLNLADLSQAVHQAPQNLTTTLAMLFLVAFGIKAAVFPMFNWLPASYHTPPTAVSAIFAGLLTKVGVYALIRVFTLLFVQDVSYTHTTILLTLAALTMTTGVLGAATQNEFRRILAFHSVSQIGYMIMGLGLYSRLAVAGAILFMAHHSIVKTNLFLISGVTNRLQGSFYIKKLGGLYQNRPMLALLFLLPALSLAGLPPLSGFWAKLSLIRAGLESEQYVMVAVALAVSLLTLFSMVKIWAEAFWKPAPSPETSQSPARGEWAALLLPVVVLAVSTLFMGLIAEPLFEVSLAAADQLLQPSAYVQAVLGSEK